MLTDMLSIQHFPKFKMTHNTWVPTLSIFPILWRFYFVLPLCTHVLLPGTLAEFLLIRHNVFSYIGKPSNYVIHVSLLVPSLLINQVLTLICQLDCYKKLECYAFGHTKFQMDLIKLKLGSDCYMDILPNASNFTTYLVYPLRTF